MESSIWLWVGFNLFVLALLAFDLGILHRKEREIKVGEALWPPPSMIAACARTTGRRIPICPYVGGKGNSSVSNHRARPNAFSPSQRHLLCRPNFKELRAGSFGTWAEASRAV
jgi:hypothetical protein